MGYIAQWLERLTADQQVPGSNPGVPSVFRLSGGMLEPPEFHMLLDTSPTPTGL